MTGNDRQDRVSINLVRDFELDTDVFWVVLDDAKTVDPKLTFLHGLHEENGISYIACQAARPRGQGTGNLELCVIGHCQNQCLRSTP